MMESRSSFSRDYTRSSESSSYHFGLQRQCQSLSTKKPLVNINKLSFSDTRKLAAIRTKTRLYEKEMNIRSRFARGACLSDALRQNEGDRLDAVRWDDLQLVEMTWSRLLKNDKNMGRRIVLYCLKDNPKRFKHILKRLPVKGREHTASDSRARAQRLPRVDSLGRRVIAAVTAIIANARNDEALMAYVTSYLKPLIASGFSHHDIELLGDSFTYYAATHCKDEHNDSHMDVWDLFVPEILNLAMPLLPCLSRSAGASGKTSPRFSFHSTRHAHEYAK